MYCIFLLKSSVGSCDTAVMLCCLINFLCKQREVCEEFLSDTLQLLFHTLFILTVFSLPELFFCQNKSEGKYISAILCEYVCMSEYTH